MKREIKFRAWHKSTKQMLSIWPYQWTKGYYQSTGVEHSFFDNKFQFSEDNKECNRIEGKSVFLSLDGTIIGLLPIDDLTTRSIDYSDEYELMQYTGLKDKNGEGKEIYEGDILECNHYYASRPWWNTIEESEKYEVKMETERNQIDRRRFEVKFDGGSFSCGYEKDLSWFLMGNRKSGQLSSGEWEERFWDFEVIGNIYENPELLTSPK